jgi:hypothetical protein
MSPGPTHGFSRAAGGTGLRPRSADPFGLRRGPRDRRSSREIHYRRPSINRVVGGARGSRGFRSARRRRRAARPRRAAPPAQARGVAPVEVLMSHLAALEHHHAAPHGPTGHPGNICHLDVVREGDVPAGPPTSPCMRPRRLLGLGTSLGHLHRETTATAAAGSPNLPGRPRRSLHLARPAVSQATTPHA